LSAVADRRLPPVVGRHARLELVFRAARGVTRLAHAYAEPPLRVGRALIDGTGVHVILASSSPGIFGGDVFEQHIVLEPGTRVKLTSQSALQVHPGARGGAARLRTIFEVQDDAELSGQLDPLIPFAASRLDQQVDVRLAPSARLLWSDAFMAGREGRGERWQFIDLRHQLRVTRGLSVEYLERHRIQPRDGQLRARWTAADCCYFGSALASGWPVGDGVADELHDDLTAINSLHAATDRLGPALVLTRLAAASGPVFHRARELTCRSFDRMVVLRRAVVLPA
jgi:urease accessory protein UreH